MIGKASAEMVGFDLVVHHHSKYLINSQFLLTSHRRGISTLNPIHHFFLILILILISTQRYLHLRTYIVSIMTKISKPYSEQTVLEEKSTTWLMPVRFLVRCRA